MEPLTSFALGLAVNYVYGFINLNLKSNVRKEIEIAFECTLSKWTPNKSIADSKRYELRGLLRERFSNGEEIYNSLNGEQRDFFELFNQELCAKQQAYNFLKAIIDEEQYRTLKVQLSSIEDQLINVGHNVDDIKRILNVNPEIKNEWEKQLDTYRGLLEDYKPKTALKLIEALNLRLEEHGLGNDNLLTSKLDYLNALSLELLGKQEEACKLYIKAFNSKRNSTTYKEKACFSYYQLNELDEAGKLKDEILNSDPFNITACAVKVLIGVDTFEDILKQIPKAVLTNFDFRRILYVSLRSREDIAELHAVFPEMTTESDEFELLELGYQNFKQNTYIVELSLNAFLKRFRVEFHCKAQLSAVDTKMMNNILLPIIQSLKGTEIESNYSQIEFFQLYIDFISNESDLKLAKLRSVFDKVKTAQSEIVFIMIADLLQKNNDYKSALEILEEYKKDSINVFNLIMFCAQKTQNIDKVVEISGRLITSINHIDCVNIDHFLRLIRMLGFYQRINDVDIVPINSKTFAFPELKILFESYVATWTNGKNESTQMLLESIEKEILIDAPLLATYFQEVYYMNQSYSECIRIFEVHSSEDVSPLDLSEYLDSIIASNGDNRKLLKWIEYWRLNICYDPRYARIEIQKLSAIGDWLKCKLTCEFAIENDLHEDFISHYALSCYYLEDLENFNSKIDLISSYAYQKVDVALQMVSILYHFHHFQKGLELAYHWAKEKNNKLARTQFFTSFMKTSEDYFKDYEEVRLDNYVHYRVNRETEEYIQVISNVQNDLSMHLLGKKVGDTVEVKRNFGNAIDTIQVVRICNKFLSLKLEIMHETKNPQSGLGLQSFNLLDYDSPLDFFKEIARPIEKVQDTYEMYYSEEIYFSHLPYYEADLNRNFVRAYYKLTHEKKGLISVDPRIFPVFHVNGDYTFILDATSLLNFFELSQKVGVTFSTRFKISSFLVSLLKEYKENTTHYWRTDSYTIDREFYLKLEQWINSHCDITNPVVFLDIVAEKDVEKDPLLLYLMHQAAMILEFDNSVLITDDLLFYKIYPLQQMKLISTDLFKIRETLKAKIR